jgi:mycothiol system anti-sigma-R factor
MTPPVALISCEEVIRSVWDYLDDEIDHGRKNQIRRHLELCDHCRDHYTFEGGLLHSLGRLLEEDGDEATATLRERIERALTEHGFSRT